MKITLKQKQEINKILNNEEKQEYGTFIEGVMEVTRILEIKL